MPSILKLSGAALLAGGAALAALSSTTAPASAARAAAAGEYTVDLVHSSILFQCLHLGVSHQWGRFNKFEGTFTLAEDPAESNVKISVEARSVDTNSEGRDEHLRGPDFFDVKQFPKMTFESKSVEKTGDDAYTVTGDLTLHGVTESIDIEVKKVGEGTSEKFGSRAGFNGTFTIDRNDFGIESYGETLGSDVIMTFAIEGIQK